ncbi:hypothetical protein GCM10011571_31440 [Marinithermofilum abyssi]|uniref:Uncharacterized protein n=1 Tax=Marinithermofilum abyssi TaxID=1571185 RepID=A0A8J2YEP2_9BACL|nr:hypothetical protein [Marinithermofilum abyssi]GGE26953.1 hypothetical protein GCM10011571_31440 [Marinithermofilum abyssi]
MIKRLMAVVGILSMLGVLLFTFYLAGPTAVSAASCPTTGQDSAPRHLFGDKDQWKEAPSDYTFCKKSSSRTITVYFLSDNQKYPNERVTFYLQRKINGKWTHVAHFGTRKNAQDESVFTLKNEYGGKPLQNNVAYRWVYVDQGPHDSIVFSQVR